MYSWTGLILLLIVAVFAVGAFWRADDVIEETESDEEPSETGDRIVSETEAAQRLRQEAQQEADPDERARLLRFADEADNNVAKIRQGLLSDQ